MHQPSSDIVGCHRYSSHFSGQEIEHIAMRLVVGSEVIATYAVSWLKPEETYGVSAVAGELWSAKRAEPDLQTFATLLRLRMYSDFIGTELDFFCISI